MTTLTQKVVIGRDRAVVHADGSTSSRPRLLEIEAGAHGVALACQGFIHLDRRGVATLIEMLTEAEREMS